MSHVEAHTPKTFSPKCIMIVEDMQDAQQSLCTLCKKIYPDARIIRSGNYNEVLVMLDDLRANGQSPDLMILDSVVMHDYTELNEGGEHRTAYDIVASIQDGKPVYRPGGGRYFHDDHNLNAYGLIFPNIDSMKIVYLAPEEQAKENFARMPRDLREAVIPVKKDDLIDPYSGECTAHAGDVLTKALNAPGRTP